MTNVRTLVDTILSSDLYNDIPSYTYVSIMYPMYQYEHCTSDTYVSIMFWFLHTRWCCIHFNTACKCHRMLVKSPETVWAIWGKKKSW